MNTSPQPKRLMPQLRITVNSRCGRACFFCRPSGEGVATGSSSQLEIDDLLMVASELYSQGIHAVKLTGGDPALYAPLEAAVAKLRNIGFETIEVISRHPLIGRRARALAEAGVTQFNISIDTLDVQLHHKICGVNDLFEVQTALDRCVATGIPVKVNTVVMSGVNDKEIDDLIEWCETRGVKTVKLLDVIKDLGEGAESFVRRLSSTGRNAVGDLYMPLDQVAPRCRMRARKITTRSQGNLGHPMTVLEMNSGFELVLKDSNMGAWYGSICQDCRLFPCHDALMALRLTADLRLQFCLLRDDVCIPLAQIIKEPKMLKKVIQDALTVYQSASFRSSSQKITMTSDVSFQEKD